MFDQKMIYVWLIITLEMNTTKAFFARFSLASEKYDPSKIAVSISSIRPALKWTSHVQVQAYSTCRYILLPVKLVCIITYYSLVLQFSSVRGMLYVKFDLLELLVFLFIIFFIITDHFYLSLLVILARKANTILTVSCGNCTRPFPPRVPTPTRGDPYGYNTRQKSVLDYCCPCKLQYRC